MLASVAPTPNPAANTRKISIPAGVLGHWLAEIDDPAELKVTLRAVAVLAPEPNRRGVPPSLTLYDLLGDSILRQVSVLRDDGAIRQALAASLHRGTLVATRDRGEIRFFLNDDCCRRYFDKAGLSTLTATDAVGHQQAEMASIGSHSAVPTALPRANIFTLYEQHIGTFGHSMAEQLKAAEKEYPAAWIEYAFSIASEHNARSWSYVNTILRRLVREGLPNGAVVANEHGKFRNDSETNRREAVLEQYRRLFGQPEWESRERNPDGS